MASEIRFTPEDWDRIERDYGAWWAGELDRPLVLLTGTEPDADLPELSGFLASHPDLSPEEICERRHAHLCATRFYGDAFPTWFINFGAGALAAFLGSKVNPDGHTVWFEPPEDLAMRDIDPAFDREGYWWRRVVDITRAAVERWDGLVAVSHTDIGGTLDVIASLRSTEGLLFDLADVPEEVERVLWKVSDFWRQCYDELTPIIAARCRGTVPWAQSWSPRRTYMLQCDFCYMISPAMFERFVLPELTAVCDHLDDAFYHLDGPGAIPHLDMMLAIPSLKGIQWIPGAGNPEAAEWLDLLRRIRDAGKLCQVFCSPEGALHVVRELGGKGFQLLIGGGFDADSAAALIQDIERADRRGAARSTTKIRGIPRLPGTTAGERQ